MVGTAATIVGTLLALYQTGWGDNAPAHVKTVPAATSTASVPTSAATITTSTPATTARPTTTTMTAAAAADAIWSSVETNPAKILSFSDFGEGMVVPRGTKVIGGPSGDGCLQFHPWVTKRGGVPADDTYLRLVLQGKQSNAVLVSSLRARIVERLTPLVGTALGCPSAGAAEPHFVSIDLDKRPPTGVFAELTETMRVVRRKPVAFTLKKNETEVFDIWAFTKQCYCKWVIELDLVVNGQHAVRTVTNNGQPFQTTAWKGKRWYEWDFVSSWLLDGEPQPRNAPLKPLA
jgi:hypothetical protein